MSRIERLRLRSITRAGLLGLRGKTLVRCSVPASQSLTEAWQVCLQFDDGTTLSLCTDPVNVGGWDEVGCLSVDADADADAEVDAEGAVTPMSSAPLTSWALTGFVVDGCQVLVYADDGWHIESGLSLRTSEGREVLIVAGIPPGSVSVALDGVTAMFSPELSVEDYGREALGVAEGDG